MSKWRPSDDYAIVFDDQTGEERTEKDLEIMVERMRGIANEYEFDLSSHGSFNGVKKFAVSSVFSSVEFDLRKMMFDSIDSED